MALALSVQHMTSNLKPLPLKELYASKKGEDTGSNLCTVAIPILVATGGISPGFSVSELYPPSPPPPTPSSGTPQAPELPALSVGQLQTALAIKPPRKAKTTSMATEGKPLLAPAEGKDLSAQGKSLPAHLATQPDGHMKDSDKESKDGEFGAAQTQGGMAQADSGTEQEQADSGMEQPPGITKADSRHSRTHSTSDYFVTPTSSPRLTPPPTPPARNLHSNRIGDRVAAKSADVGRRHETFFSSLPAKFENLELEAMDGIPTEQFLKCCQDLLPFFGEHSHYCSPWKM